MPAGFRHFNPSVVCEDVGGVRRVLWGLIFQGASIFKGGFNLSGAFVSSR